MNADVVAQFILYYICFSEYGPGSLVIFPFTNVLSPSFPERPIRLAGVSDTSQLTTLPGLHPQIQEIQARVLETNTCLLSNLYCWIGWILVWVLVFLE